MSTRHLRSLRFTVLAGLVVGLWGCEDVAKTDYLHAAAALRQPIANLGELRDAMATFDKHTNEAERMGSQVSVGVLCEQALPKIRTLQIDTSKLRDDNVLLGVMKIRSAVRDLDDAMKPCDRKAPGGATAHPGALMCGKACIVAWPAVVKAVDELADEAKKKEVNASRLGAK